MRILRNIILLVFPIAIMVSLYGFIINGSEVQYRGLTYIYNHFSTFPGLDTTFRAIDSIGEYATDLVEYFKEGAGLDVIIQLFKVVAVAFVLPVTVIISIIQDIVWVLAMLFGA